MNTKFVLNEETGCWEWSGALNRANGYGTFQLNGKRQYAHRFFYEQKFGQIPAGKCACHKCDNPKCVNPDHIFLGSHHENMIDAARKGRIGKRKNRIGLCKRGHSLSGPDSRGWMYCKICRLNQQRQRRGKS